MTDSSPHDHLLRAYALHQKGDLNGARAGYLAVLGLVPDNTDALHLLGVAESQLGNPAAAITYFEQAIRIQPHWAEAYSNMGIALRKLGRNDEALAAYEKALLLKPEYPEALSNRATVLIEQKNYAEALACCNRAIDLQPDSEPFLLNRVIALNGVERHAEALADCLRLTESGGRNPDVLFNMGNAYLGLRRYEEALGCFNTAASLKTPGADLLVNRGVAFAACDRFDEALASYGQAIVAQPKHVAAYINRGAAYYEIGCYEQAMHDYAEAISLQPANAEAHWNYGLQSLLRGDYAEGWRKYEWRWKNTKLGLKDNESGKPRWLGEEALDRKRILLWMEQGYGDTLQMLRYVPQVIAEGATVYLMVQPHLKALIARGGLDCEVYGYGEPLPEYDLHCPLLSLPLAFRTVVETIPGPLPYLAADQAKLACWSDWLGEKKKPRVGVAWSGNPAHRNDQRRSIPFGVFAGLQTAPYEFVCLQKEIRNEDRAIISGWPALRCPERLLNDFDDTAALIELMDMVISVDTSIAHLAGCMGKQTWVLLPYAPDWRWLLKREDSPWYPTVRLFRQVRRQDWSDVLARVNDGLADLLPGSLAK